MEAILALPIDWQKVAVERQWEKKQRKEEDIRAKSLSEIKRAPRPKRRQKRIVRTPSNDSTLHKSSLDSALGLNLYGTPSTPELHFSLASLSQLLSHRVRHLQVWIIAAIRLPLIQTFPSRHPFQFSTTKFIPILFL